MLTCRIVTQHTNFIKVNEPLKNQQLELVMLAAFLWKLQVQSLYSKEVLL